MPPERTRRLLSDSVLKMVPTTIILWSPIISQTICPRCGLKTNGHATLEVCIASLKHVKHDLEDMLIWTYGRIAQLEEKPLHEPQTEQFRYLRYADQLPDDELDVLNLAESHT